MDTYILHNKSRLQIAYAVLCVICFLQIMVTAFFFQITSELILQQYEAAEFMKQVHSIPLSYEKLPFYAFFGFLLLMGVMHLRSRTQETTIGSFLFLALEIVLCLWMLKTISFSTNEVFLLVAANMLTLTRNKGSKGVSLFLIVLFFLGTNYNVISRFLPVTSFDDYLYIYTAQANAVFQGMRSILATITIISFLVYILFLIQDQIMESRYFKDMNSELQELNEQLKEVADVREKMGETKERNRLAREIHDTLGHTLTGLSTGIDAAASLVDEEPELAKKQLTVLSTTAKAGLQDVRRSVKKLRPDTLEKHSLKEALDTMIQEFMVSTGVHVHFICHLSSLSFQKEEEEIIYRILQESLTNSVRHGKASEVYISVSKDHETLIMIIEDNGIGCSQIEEGFGLHHMRERVDLLHGKLRYYGTHGFEVLVEIPLRREQMVK